MLWSFSRQQFQQGREWHHFKLLRTSYDCQMWGQKHLACVCSFVSPWQEYLVGKVKVLKTENHKIVTKTITLRNSEITACVPSYSKFLMSCDDNRANIQVWSWRTAGGKSHQLLENQKKNHSGALLMRHAGARHISTTSGFVGSDLVPGSQRIHSYFSID